MGSGTADAATYGSRPSMLQARVQSIELTSLHMLQVENIGAGDRGSTE